MRILSAILLLGACGTDFTTDDTTDAGSGSEYAPLITDDWSIPAGTETYHCVRQTMTRDTWIRSIRPIDPSGTHHLVVMLGASTGPDGTTTCDSGLPAPAIYASAVGSQALDMPEGVALHARPGQQLLLNVHLFNASESSQSGRSGVEVIETTAAEVAHEAGVVLAGKVEDLVVAPGASTQTGQCSTPAGATAFAVMPHMHVLGTHMKVSYAGGGAEPRVLHDRDFKFDDQRFERLEPALETTAGGKLTVECSYFNPTGSPVYFGESTTQEMCFALAFIYPPPTIERCTQ